MERNEKIVLGIGAGAVVVAGAIALFGRKKCQDGAIGDIDTNLVTEDQRIERKSKSTERLGPDRSAMFTWTSKIHAPSWSLPAVRSCPAVCGPITRALEQPGEVDLKELVDAVPKKCLSCYAHESGKYSTTSTKRAQQRRMEWFDSAPDDEVVDTLVAAIDEAGDEACTRDRATKRTPWRRGKRKDEVKCVRDRNATPTHFRLFDSGDFHDERAVRIWTEVARRMPQVRFWAPTTAWDPDKHANLHEALEELASLPNLALKPSSYEMDVPAPTLELGRSEAAGSTVLSWTSKKVMTRNCPWTDPDDAGEQTCFRTVRELVGATDKRGDPVRYDPADDTTRPPTVYIDGVKHALCRGDCAKCRLCWQKGTRVGYVQHGPSVATEERELERLGSMRDLIASLLPQQVDIGPAGVSETRLPARSPTRRKPRRKPKRAGGRKPTQTTAGSGRRPNPARRRR